MVKKNIFLKDKIYSIFFLVLVNILTAFLPYLLIFKLKVVINYVKKKRTLKINN